MRMVDVSFCFIFLAIKLSMQGFLFDGASRKSRAMWRRSPYLFFMLHISENPALHKYMAGNKRRAFNVYFTSFGHISP